MWKAIFAGQCWTEQTLKIRQKSDRIKEHSDPASPQYKKKARFFWEAGFLIFLFSEN
jgi:hypothetical protein